MSPTSLFHFWNAADIADSRKSPCYLSTPGVANQWEGKSISNCEFSSQSTVTSLKTENWGSNSGDHLGFESCRLGQNPQEASPTSIDRSALASTVTNHNSAYSENMSTYLPGSNAQTEALQTLYLMNPGYGGYGNTTNSGNMVLFNGASGTVGGHISPLGHSDQQQHQFVKMSHPSTVAESPLAHQGHMVSMHDAELGHQNNSYFFQSRPGNHMYNWNGGNGLSFIPPSQVSDDNHTAVQVKSGQLSASDLQNYGNRLGYHEEASLFPDNVTAHGINLESLQASAGAGQILSLSLSSQQPAMMQQLQSFPLQHNDSAASFYHGQTNPDPDNSSLSKEVMLSSKCLGANVGSTFPVQSCDNLLGMGYNNPAESNRQMNMIPGHLIMGSFHSKYLRPAQELLNEVVSIGNGGKNTSFKQSKPQAWIGPSPVNDLSFPRDKSVVDYSSKNIVSWSDKKEGDSIVTAVPITMTGMAEQSMDQAVELTAAERQELQEKRAKLMGMRDEVDRRYKQYYHQMQTVVASFESAAGLGAATTYTSLALSTISKHFRCLRDAITGQIQVTCKALGDEEVSGFGRGEPSKLRLIGQQLRQQRALRQLGMMQQQAWRPQRGLPEHSVSILRAWLFEHFLHPYPKDADKILLARQTGLTRNQVSNWFINARVRLWKPMVEEMYLEETKEAEAQGAEKSGRDEGEISEGGTTGMEDGSGGNEMNKPAKQLKLSDDSHDDFNEAKNISSYAPEVLQARELDGSPADSLMFQEKESMRQGLMKPKNTLQDSSSLLTQSVSFKSDADDVLEHEMKMRTKDSYREAYGIGHNGFVQTDQLNLSGYGSYQMNGMNRYSQDTFPESYPSSGAVSLTLGLQHCEGSSFSGSQQHYGGQNHANLPTVRQEDGSGSVEYYTLNDNSYEALGLQNRKPFPPHMLRRDFVV